MFGSMLCTQLLTLSCFEVVLMDGMYQLMYLRLGKRQIALIQR